ncbi:hypothetical protein HU200_016476 [Digitaria exilis]|uniref:Uncharacterized protein n=1 Tax=Digitaria exilis TaxID=1010633 RepID=A0A835KIN6_9POAL|nr:hypothetical protein HU200_016476 [Digitaria exilis]
MFRPMASSSMTCARSRTQRRRSSISSTDGLEKLPMKKFTDLVVSSPRTAERRISIILFLDSLLMMIGGRGEKGQ